MVAIAMLLVTILKAPTTVYANQDFTKMEKTAARVSKYKEINEAWCLISAVFRTGI